MTGVADIEARVALVRAGLREAAAGLSAAVAGLRRQTDVVLSGQLEDEIEIEAAQ